METKSLTEEPIESLPYDHPDYELQERIIDLIKEVEAKSDREEPSGILIFTHGVEISFGAMEGGPNNMCMLMTEVMEDYPEVVEVMRNALIEHDIKMKRILTAAKSSTIN